MNTSWFVRLEQTQTSYLRTGDTGGDRGGGRDPLPGRDLGLGVAWCGSGRAWSDRQRFLLWQRSFAWASWQEFLVIVCGIFLLSGLAGGRLPGLRVICGLATLAMGAMACLAYMCIDLERNEVERGHKASIIR